MRVKLVKLTDGKTEWVALLIDNHSVAAKAAQDILGHSIQEIELNTHALYQKDRRAGMIGTVSVDVVKRAFKDILEYLYQDRHVIMNIKGGYIFKDSIDWEILETMEFEVDYSANLYTLLREQNGVRAKIERIA